MKHKPPSKRDLLRSSEPWFPIISRVCQAAFRDVLAGVPVLGNPRKTERANDLHRAVRENFRRVCDLGHFLRLVEEPEGKGLDYIVSSLNPDVQIGYRWGRYDGVAVRRNPSLRTKDFHEQGTLFSLVDDEPSGMPMLTVGLAIADDFWEANKPCWWLGRIMLLQERQGENEVLTEIAAFAKPDERETHVPPEPLITAREDEVLEWERIVNEVRWSA